MAGQETEGAEQARRKQIRRLILVFFAGLLILTFFSRTITSLTLPVVSAETPTSGSLLKEVTGEGGIASRESVGVYTQRRLRIAELHAGAGSRVRAGQILAVLDLGVFSDAFARYRSSPDAAAASPDSLFAALAKQGTERLEMQVELAGAHVRSLEAKRAVQVELLGLSIGSRQEVAQAEENLATARVALLREEEALAGTLRTNAEQIRELILVCPVDGEVTEVRARPGDLSDPNQPLILIAGSRAGFEVVISVPVEKSEYVGVGERVQLRVKSLSGQVAGRVRDVRDDPMNRGLNRQVVIDLDRNDALRGGERAEMRLVKSTSSYPLLVSSSAVHTDVEGDYLWIVKERRGTLGTEYVVVRSNTQVLDSDNQRSALAGGIDAREKYVSSSTKPLEQGTVVRME